MYTAYLAACPRAGYGRVQPLWLKVKLTLYVLSPLFHCAQIVAALAVALGPLAAGLGKGYASPAIASLQELSLRPTTNDSTVTFTVSDQEASWVASLSLLGEYTKNDTERNETILF